MDLTTARLRIDDLATADADALFAYRADPTVARFQGWRPARREDASDFIARQLATPPDAPGWRQRAIRLHDDRRLIGDIGVNLPADADESVEFGISLAPAVHGRGYAAEAMHALLGWVFETAGRRRVHASVDPRNTASVALLRRLGMRQEAHFRESLHLHGEWVDDVVFALLAREWQTPRRAGAEST